MALLNNQINIRFPVTEVEKKDIKYAFVGSNNNFNGGNMGISNGNGYNINPQTNQGNGQPRPSVFLPEAQPIHPINSLGGLIHRETTHIKD